MEPVQVDNPFAIRISRTSWHYRYLNFLNGRPELCQSLCSYFWRLMFVLFLTGVVAPGVAVGVLYLFYFIFSNIGNWIMPAISTVFISALLVLVIFGGMFLQDKHHQAKKHRLCQRHEQGLPDPVTTWELFWKWVAAKKAKVCPPIVFTDLE